MTSSLADAVPLVPIKAMRDGAANETARARKRAGSKRARYFVPALGTIKTPGVYRRDPGVSQPQLILLFPAVAFGRRPGTFSSPLALFAYRLLPDRPLTGSPTGKGRS